MKMQFRIPGSMLMALCLAFLCGGCASDACKNQKPEAQIDIRVVGIDKSKIAKVVVGISFNNGKVRTKAFFKPEPSFVLGLDYYELDREPYLIRVLAYARDKNNKLLGVGDVGAYYTFDGCNHFQVPVRPKTPLDGGVDQALQDMRRKDQALPDQNVPDAAKKLDRALPDGPALEGGPDGPLPDQRLPDSKPLDTVAVPDKPLSDSWVPDKMPADIPISDKMPQDQALPDQLVPDAQQPPDAGVPSATKWVTVKAGTFQMGSPVSEPCREKTAGVKETQHNVTLTYDFVIGDQETTQAEYQAVQGINPAYFSSCGGTCPVEKVTWHMAAAYCNALSQKDGLSQCYACTGKGNSVSCGAASAFAGAKIYDCLGYRLPTEAEWEYAYRAGTTSAFYNGPISASSCSTTNTDPNANKIGWYVGNANTKTHPARGRLQNSLGLYDMPGNVVEWTHDWWQTDLGTGNATDPVGAVTGMAKSVKGGGAPNGARFLRAAHRSGLATGYSSPWTGFRCARSLPKWNVMTSGTTNDLRGVWGVNDQFVFAVGKVGTILHYKGQTWTKHSSPTNSEITGVWGGNIQGPFYASPFGSSVLIWNGSTWKSSPIGTSVMLTAITGISNATSTWVWAVGSSTKVIHYNWPNWSHLQLGGNTWLRSVYAKSTSNVWAGGDAANIYEFSGSKWTKRTTGLPGTQIFYGLYAPSSSQKEVYAVGGNDSMITKFDGKTWQSLAGKGTAYAIHGSGPSNIYVVGPAGKILHYDGTTWTQQTSPTKEHLYGVWVDPSGTAFAVGNKGTIIQKP